MKQITYKDAGVDITKGEESISGLKESIHSTFTPNVLSNVGAFGGLFELNTQEYQKPVLVSSTDGVGTKLKIAILANRHSTVGQDLVNHCVNDIAVMGAKPLFFLDYFATAALDSSVFTQVINGFTKACREAKIALIGGETAEMPGFYQVGDYDMSGTIVGIVEKSQILSGSEIRKGDILVGIQSNGLHTNGYSLARKILLEQYSVDQYIEALGKSLADELLLVHKNYFNVIQAIIPFHAKGFSHITGGGIIGNTKRLLKNGLNLKVNWNSWDSQPIFSLIQKLGNVPDDDMRRTFNLGIGLVAVLPSPDVDNVLGHLKSVGEKAWVIGEVV